MAKLVYPADCPECGYILENSHRRGFFEKVLSRVFRVGVFRCHRCGVRFYSPPAVVVRAARQSTSRRRLLEETDCEVITLPAGHGAHDRHSEQFAVDAAEFAQSSEPEPQNH